MSTSSLRAGRAPVTLRVPFAASSVSVARQKLKTWLVDSGVRREVVDDARVVISELVGNSVRHAQPLADGDIVVSWAVDDRGLQILDACRRAGLASASLWAAIPHYVAAVPNPKAALALLRRLEGLTGIAVEASELEDATERFEEQVDRAVSANPEIEELVRNLEASQEESLELGHNVTADDIAQEFQRFLRQRGTDKN